VGYFFFFLLAAVKDRGSIVDSLAHIFRQLMDVYSRQAAFDCEPYIKFFRVCISIISLGTNKTRFSTLVSTAQSCLIATTSSTHTLLTLLTLLFVQSC
jgi:hypothetical protein